MPPCHPLPPATTTAAPNPPHHHHLPSEQNCTALAPGSTSVSPGASTLPVIGPGISTSVDAGINVPISQVRKLRPGFHNVEKTLKNSPRTLTSFQEGLGGPFQVQAETGLLSVHCLCPFLCLGRLGGKEGLGGVLARWQGNKRL